MGRVKFRWQSDWLRLEMETIITISRACLEFWTLKRALPPRAKSYASTCGVDRRSATMSHLVGHLVGHSGLIMLVTLYLYQALLNLLVRHRAA